MSYSSSSISVLSRTMPSYASPRTTIGATYGGTSSYRRTHTPSRVKDYNPHYYASTVYKADTGRPLPATNGLTTNRHNSYGSTTSQYSSSYRSDSISRNVPIKATREYGKSEYGKSYSPVNKHGTLYGTYTTSERERISITEHTSSKTSTYGTGGLTRSKRNNSITNLSSRTGSLSLTDSKKFGSQSSLDRVARPREIERNGDLYDNPKSKTVPTGNYIHTSAKAYDYKDTEHETNLKNGTLPDISSRTSSISRSPSLDSESPSRKALSTNHHNNLKSSPESASQGLVGLKNLGNTCFMNSVIQCLSNTSILLDYCASQAYERDINRTSSSMRGALIEAYANLMKDLWSASSYISPTNFKKQIQKFAARFMGYSQQDAQEFLVYLLEGLHEDVNRIREKKKRRVVDDSAEDDLSASEKAKATWSRYLEYDDSKLVETFVGQLRSTLKCSRCQYESNTFDPFWDLSLPIAKSSRGVSLQSCFELFTQIEELDGDERPTCAKCKKPQKCTKQFKIQKFPKVLVIHLKRFDVSSYYRSKLSTTVDFPLKDLDLSHYAADSCQMRSPILYNLYAVSNHSGTPYGGHYTAYCKHPHSGKWHYFNDQRVTSVTPSSIVGNEAYVLFYELSTGASKL